MDDPPTDNFGSIGSNFCIFMQSIAFWPRPQNCTMIGIEGISHLFVRIDMEQTHKQCEWDECRTVVISQILESKP